jgi:hypothetical protein
MVPLQKWAAGLGLTAVAVTVSYLWLDRLIAMAAHGTTTQSPIFAELTYLPEPLVPMSLLALFALGLWALVGQPLYKPHRVVLLCSVSLIVAESFKNELKFIFGVASVLWICYPRLRPLYGAVVGAVAIGLIGADYHFLSDIIAGGFVGTTTGWFAVLLRGADVTKPSTAARPIGFLN